IIFIYFFFFFFFQAEDGIRDFHVTGVQTCALPIYLFGESGFGVIANYTTVDGNVKYDDQSLDEQFALLGLSDSANLVGFYDKDGLQARIAYNWRDTFLVSRSEERRVGKECRSLQRR